MATVNAQSVEDFADRIVYRFPAGRYEQIATTWGATMTPGLKVLVNTDTTRSYVIPASGVSAKFFKIEWFFKLGVVFQNDAISGTPLVLVEMDFLKFLTPAPALSYDGKSLQTEFYQEKTENIYQSPQLRAINISNISVEPRSIASNYLGGSTSLDARVSWNIVSSVSYLVALFQPTVTFYKK